MINRNKLALIATLLTVLCVRTASAQNGGTIALNSGFMPDPSNLSGMSGGPVSASDADSQCRGYINPVPSHVLTTQSGFRFLRVFVDSQQDTTLVIRGRNQTWCADDTYGLNPGLDLQALPPGRYEIYVGSYAQGNSAPYRLSITELPNVTPDGSGSVPSNNGNTNNGNNGNAVIGPRNGGSGAAPLNATLAPAFGRINLPGHISAPHFSTGRTTGAVDASAVQGTGTCRGFMTTGPSFIANIGENQQFLRVFVTSAADTTLAVQYPDGHVECSDDSFGTLHPSIEGAFPAGTYAIWVGIYRSGVTRPFRLAITPDQTQHP